MNTKHIDIAKELANGQIVYDIFNKHREELSDSAGAIFVPSAVTFYAYTRRDLEIFMSVSSGPWTKHNAGRSLCYESGQFSIYASSEALPPTCRTEKRIRYIPASEAREVEEEVVICDVAQS